jgi:hypothetical protein
MPNIALALKSGISRVARKAIRAETEDFKKVSAQYRKHIAALRKRIELLERELKRVAHGTGRTQECQASAAPETVNRRFSASRCLRPGGSSACLLPISMR